MGGSGEGESDSGTSLETIRVSGKTGLRTVSGQGGFSELELLVEQNVTPQNLAVCTDGLVSKTSPDGVSALMQGATTVHKVRPPPTRCDHLPQDETTVHKVRPPSTRCDHRPQGAITFHKVRPPSTRCDHRPQGATTVHKV